jgi:hypothetical protein
VSTDPDAPPAQPIQAGEDGLGLADEMRRLRLDAAALHRRAIRLILIETALVLGVMAVLIGVVLSRLPG